MVTEPCQFCVDPDMCMGREICLKRIIDQGEPEDDEDDGFTIIEESPDDEIINENFGIN